METLRSTLSLSDERPKRGGSRSPGPCLFLVLEGDRLQGGGARHSLGNVDLVEIGRGGQRSVERRVENGVRRLVLRLPDRWMSAHHAQIQRVLGRWVLEDTGSRNGTFVDGTVASKTVLEDGDVVEMGHSFFLFRESVALSTDDPEDLDSGALQPPAPGLGTLLPGLARELAALETVAHSTVSVVIRGETGTGKEVIARGLHLLSRRSGAFVAVNCGALPDTILETELFGYRKGAFSGAQEDRPGLVRSADHGTLFLDEIGDLPPSSQAAFLRVLQEREVMPVGATRAVAVDLRLIAATHRDLDELIAANQFRADLYARIADFTITLPPLRQRREDLGLLVADLLRRRPGGLETTFTVPAARLLLESDWPLNIRELEKSLGAATVLAQGAPIDVTHLPASLKLPPRPRPGERPLNPAERQHREELVALLQQHCGNVSAVARSLGKARMQIHRWLKRYALDLESFRRPAE